MPVSALNTTSKRQRHSARTARRPCRCCLSRAPGPGRPCGGEGDATVNGQPASELRIIDHGQGVDTDKILAMFRPFQRLSDNPAATGVGLGLAVAKGFTEAMSGALTAEQTPGGGLTMVIRLPLSTGAELPARTGTAAAEPQSRILQRFVRAHPRTQEQKQ